MFLSVEWAKRWLPAVFLLLSLVLPWWMWNVGHWWVREGFHLPYSESSLSFPWDEDVSFFIVYSPTDHMSFWVDFNVQSYRLPVSCFVSVLIFVSGLFGLFVRNKIRTLGGLLGIAGVISYFALVLPESLLSMVHVYYPFSGQMRDFPYFGSGLTETRALTWFLSAGFYLALAGSLMLLSPTIRKLIERLRERLKSS